MADQDLSKLKVTELREMLKARGLNSVGNKQELIDRLQLSIVDSSVDLDSNLEDELLNDDELDDEKSLLDSTQDDILKSPSGSINSTSPESSNSAPKKPISLKRNISISVPVVESTTSTEVASVVPTGDEPDKKVVKLSQMTAQERLEMRAKKFGSSVTSSTDPVVSDEKIKARAARFGITAPSAAKATPEATAKNIELLKKRAERFGAVLVPELKAEEAQEKLLKRQERFGSESTTKTTITGPTTTKSEYEEKALKRLERFGKTTA